MSLFIVDVESDGPIPPKYSMVCFGVVKLIPELNKTFFGLTKPISDIWSPDALEISGFSREQHLNFEDPVEVMRLFAEWLQENSKGRPTLISDNNGYDASWINYYFHTYYGSNPFGWTSRRIGDLYCGMMKDTYANWKFLRVTRHSHNPLDDAMGNAEALLKMKEMGLKIDTK